MAENFVEVTSGSGLKLHTWSRTIGANTVHDEFTLPGEYPLATYSVVATAVSTATANDHLLQIMAGSSLNVRIRSITISQAAAAGSVASARFQLFRLTTAGTGGTSITARPYDTADAAAGATAMTLPSSKGTEGVTLFVESMWLGTAAIPTHRVADWIQTPGTKPILIPAGTSNGLAIKSINAVASATVDIAVEFVETSF